MTEEIVNYITENVPDGTPIMAIQKAAHHVLLDQPIELAASIKKLQISGFIGEK